MANLRLINFEKEKHFECGGKKFYLRDSLSFNRYRELQTMIIEFSFSATFVDLFKNVNAAWDFMNSLKFGEAAIVLHNIMMGVKSLETKYDVAFRMCALFIDQEGEDPTKYDESQMKEKIDCWAEELDVSPFFHLAANLVPSWMNAYKIVSRNGLNDQEIKQ